MAYSRFKTAVFCTAYDVQWIDWDHFQDRFGFFEKHCHIDKAYLETYRTEVMVDEAKIKAAKAFFERKGIACSGGITFTARGKTTWDFKSFCYSSGKYVDELARVIEFASSLFDEVILDDFYFTNCKCDSCIAEKGGRSWDLYRGEKMREMSELVVGKARAVNPNCRVVIKFPNWYEDYQYTGYNLRDQRQIHGAIYTGTETRDPALTQQNLPRYLSYFLMRYLENSLPGGNGGGWFDPFDCSYNLNSYLEQAYLTLFSKAREVTLFCLGALLTGFRQFVPLAGYAFESFDLFADKLGEPRGIACYKPFNSSGDDYMLPALGMLGIPLEPTPFFPVEADTLILAKSAAADPELLLKVKAMLERGKTVLITSALAALLRDAGLRDIVDVEVEGVFEAESVATDMHLCGFKRYSPLRRPILFPKIRHRTNDSWALVSALGAENGNPILIECSYSKGSLLILNVPERFSDLYELPQEALDRLRSRLAGELGVRISAPAGVGLFVYDNGSFIVESFLPHTTPVEIFARGAANVLRIDAETPGGFSSISTAPVGDSKDGEYSFTIDLAASTFQAFQCRAS